MNEIDLALKRHKNRTERNLTTEKEDKSISKYFTKILLSLIFLLGCTIYIKLSPENLEIFKSHVFENNLTFTKINNWYHETFGSILPTVTEPKDQIVSTETNVLKRENYQDGYQISISKGTPIASITSGILVFMGEKEGYGNTLIIQGVDGTDIWYGSITDSNLKLSDYLDANTILGTSSEDKYFLVFQKDGEYLTYEEYFNQVSS